MKKSNIYTRHGDQGQTSLATGERVAKTHPRLEAYGTLDELSAHIGLLLADVTDETHREELLAIQRHLFTIGGQLASTGSAGVTPVSVAGGTPAPPVLALERAIDAADAPLGGWRGFILPGGTRAAAQAHVCRTVCRRFERRLLALAADVDVAPDTLQYANRLSDYFFVLARHLNYLAGQEENYWRKG